MAENKPENRRFRNPPASRISKVWGYFGLPLDAKVTDIAICKQCFAEVKSSGGTTNLRTHLRRHHNLDVTDKRQAPQVKTEPAPSTSTGSSKPAATPLVTPFTRAAQAKLPQTKVNRLNAKVANYLIKDMRPFSTVNSEAFKALLEEAEPRYKLPDRCTFSENFVPKINSVVVQRVKADMAASNSVAWTTDSWTSKATESYVTITAHFCKDFQLNSAVLQTRLLSSSHTGENVGQVLKEAATEWGCAQVCLTTDNAANMSIAAKVAGVPIHLGCFAHTLNLASSKAVGVQGIHGVLAKMRSVVGLFHRSTTAAGLLTEKQELLKIPKHKATTGST